MTISPFVMIVLEAVILIVIVVIAVVFLAVQPGLLNEVTKLAQLLQGETNEEVILQLISPYLIKPGVIVTALFYVAFLIPLIEELFKPLAVWLFARSIETPAQGFALGLISGAAFALIESLNAGADGSSSWSMVVSVRAGTSLLHITASGLVGWGIVSAFREKKILRLLGAYLCSVTIHGIWNACAVAAGVSAVAGTLGKPEWLFTIAPAAVCGMVVLGLGMFVVLIAANQRLRTSNDPAKTL
jgi:RsiW-degrading membrane proteinase PrsW (M82 family)